MKYQNLIHQIFSRQIFTKLLTVTHYIVIDVLIDETQHILHSNNGKKTLFMVSAIDVIHEKFIAKIYPLKWKTRKT